jgi:7-keto-8-aminopelargonate synthetase-like enzyme/CheY-like chemotaxis protein
MPDSYMEPFPVEPLIEDFSSAALTGSMRDFRELHGTDLLGRVAPFYKWQEARRTLGYWPYSKSTDEAPQPVCAARDDAGHAFRGVNFASQDYLGLASHPLIKATAKATIDEYGVHSAGSSALAGNTKYSLALERVVSEYLQLDHTILYPTGWAAGYGAIKGLVRPDDHVILDGLSHACLQEGAYSATRNVHLHGHLKLDSARRHLQRIRARDTKNAILVVTESLFSMDSDTPDLAALQALCREYDAWLMVDVAHDLGCMGTDGRGLIGRQQMLGKTDIVMGSFSKTFASNGGFVSCRSPAVREYLKFYGCSATFSNALSPVQCATVLQAFDIVQSEEGRQRRQRLMDSSVYLRAKLRQAGFEVIGEPSAIVPAVVGPEALARIVSQRLPALGVVANLVEFPAVAKGNARFRLQVMASHSRQNIDDLVNALRTATDAALGDYRHHDAHAAASTVPVRSELDPIMTASPGEGRLLAIDDNHDCADLVVRVANRCGYQARALGGQAELPQVLRDWKPDVLTLDLCMPGADGINLFSVLQAGKFDGDVVIISGQDDWLRKVAGRLAKVRGLRVVEDLAKPVDLARLQALLKELRAREPAATLPAAAEAPAAIIG